MASRSKAREHSKTRKAAAPKKSQAVEIVVRYQSADGPLTDAQKKKLIRNIKKEKYYYEYLSGHFRFVFEDSSRCSEGLFTWKGGAADGGIVFTRVVDLLTGDFGVLPEGVGAKLISVKEV